MKARSSSGSIVRIWFAIAAALAMSDGLEV
jgi:hypothetical protein